jgi:hypothetical protein
MTFSNPRWKILRVLALGMVAAGISANSEIPKVKACIVCSGLCTNGLCTPVCSEAGNSGGQNCTTYNGVCQVFGSCTPIGGGDGGGGFGGIGN